MNSNLLCSYSSTYWNQSVLILMSSCQWEWTRTWVQYIFHPHNEGHVITVSPSNKSTNLYYIAGFWTIDNDTNKIKGKGFRIHRVIYSVFNGTIPNGLEVGHIGSVRENNNLSTLKQLTRLDNIRKSHLAPPREDSKPLIIPVKYWSRGWIWFFMETHWQ